MSINDLATQLRSLLSAVREAGIDPAELLATPAEPSKAEKLAAVRRANLAKGRAAKAAKAEQTAVAEHPAVVAEQREQRKVAPVVKLSETLRHLYLAVLAYSDLNESEENPNVRFRNPAVWIWQIRDLGRSKDGESPADPIIAKLDEAGELFPALTKLCEAGALTQHVSKNGKIFYSPAVKGYDPAVRRTTVKTDARDNERRSSIMRRMRNYSATA